MKINNLSQLKKALTKGALFKIVNHNKPEFIGDVREVNVVQTNAIYSVMHNNPEHKISKANGGRGSWMEYNKASHYEFADTIKWYAKPIGSEDNYVVMEFQVL